MSQWTHITGCIRLSISPYSKSTNNEGEDIFTLKYPKEQCKITKVRHYNKDEPIRVTMSISSLPVAKKAIKPLMKQIMPQGELGLTYFINQDSRSYGSSHNYFTDGVERETYEELCKKKFGSKYNDKDYKLDWIQTNAEITLTIADDIRYCSGEELYNAFIKLFKAFDLAGIYINGCSVIWKDGWSGGRLYRITQRGTDNKIVFEVRDVKKDEVEKPDVFLYDYDSDGLVKEEYLSLDDLENEE